MNMSRKIIILGYSGSVHIIRWARGLARRRYDITVISLGGDKIDDVETVILPESPSRKLGYFKHAGRVKTIIKNIRPDLLHSHYATGFGLWGMHSGYHPHIISVWGADVIDFPNNRFKKALLKRILRSADHITATSRFLKDKTRELFPDIDDKTDVIPFGVDIPDIIKKHEKKDRTRLVFIKAHRGKYGPDILIEAVARAVKGGHRIHLTMAGEGEMTDALKQKVKDLRLDDYVNFTGFIENTGMPEFLAIHDIMVMPSVMESESFGVAVLEASAVGLPVIASNIGGVPGVLKDGETGILVPPGDVSKLADTIIRLADNAEVQKKMGEAGRKFVADNYRWDKCLDKMSALYEKSIAGRDKI